MKEINGIFYPDLEDAKNATCEICHWPDCDGSHAVLGKGTVYFKLNKGVYYGSSDGGKVKQFLKDNWDIILCVSVMLGLAYLMMVTL